MPAKVQTGADSSKENRKGCLIQEFIRSDSPLCFYNPYRSGIVYLMHRVPENRLPVLNPVTGNLYPFRLQ